MNTDKSNSWEFNNFSDLCKYTDKEYMNLDLEGRIVNSLFFEVGLNISHSSWITLSRICNDGMHKYIHMETTVLSFTGSD